MAPARKRAFGVDACDLDMLACFEVELVSGPVAKDTAHRQKRVKGMDFADDLQSYLGTSSDEELEAVVAIDLGADVLDVSMLREKENSAPTAFFGEQNGTADFYDLPGDESPSASDEDGYVSMISSPAHELESTFDVPLIVDDDSLVSATDPASALIASVSIPEPAVQEKFTPVLSIVDPLFESAAPLGIDVAATVALDSPAAAPASAQADSKDAAKANQSSTRWAHNSTERKRRLEIRKLFSGLRDLFPDIAGDDKISNINTLNRAIDCVAELKAQDAEYTAAIAALRDRNAAHRARADEVARARAEHAKLLAAEVPPTALAVLKGTAGRDPEMRKQLPAALRQLLDHNGRGNTETVPLARRRTKAPVCIDA